MKRRAALTRIASIAGGIGLAFASVPFVRYFVPSERAKALGSAVSVDLASLMPGQVRSIVWRGQPVLVMRRSKEQLAALELTDDRLLDDSEPTDGQPTYVDASFRSVNPEYLVLLGNCTHLGCVPRQDSVKGKKLLGSWFPGGFHCPCHDSIYDNAGRVVRGPAPSNLRVPPHYFASSKELIVGADAAET
jgi:ubiquinol-cytochrome c reductase iron-sulfur subunit